MVKMLFKENILCESNILNVCDSDNLVDILNQIRINEINESDECYSKLVKFIRNHSTHFLILEKLLENSENSSEDIFYMVYNQINTEFKDRKTLFNKFEKKIKIIMLKSIEFLTNLSDEIISFKSNISKQDLIILILKFVDQLDFNVNIVKNLTSQRIKLEFDYNETKKINKKINGK